MTWVLLVLAGGFGGVARYGLSSALNRPAWAWGTMAVNLSGALAIGFVAATFDHEAARVLGTGFLGGYTTFSGWMVESLRITNRRLAVLNLVGMAVAAVGAAALGVWLGA